jgi:hypothetical protein
MTTSHLRLTRALRTLAVLSVAICTLLSVDVAAGSAHGVRAFASRAVPRSLASAAALSRTADQTLVADAKALKQCLLAHSTQPSLCDGARAALQQAGRNLRAAEQKLSTVAQQTASSRSATSAKSAYWDGAYAARQSPRLSVNGHTLAWNRVAGIDNYVFVRKVPGQADQYSTVTGTSTTPPPVPGLTVSYSVRTAVDGSVWAPERTIAYPALSITQPGEEGLPETGPSETSPSETKTPEVPDTQAAPQLTVSGETLTWSAIGSVNTYVLAIKVPGRQEIFTEVSGTSVTPSVVPGVTVHYSLRTAVDGSAWSPEVAISYPAASTPPPSSPPASSPPASSPPATSPPPKEEPEKSQSPPSVSSMWVGVDAGGWPSSFAADVAGAASYVRLENPTNISGWTAAGVKVIDDMAGPSNSGGVSAINATEWAAKAVTAVKANPQIAAVEVLNEPGNVWEGWGSSAGSSANAAAYDHLLKVVHEAFVANFGSSYPPILASYDGGEGPTTWGEEMWAAEPNIGNYINGITLHSYGGTSNRTQSALGDRHQIELAHSQHPTIPIYITEVGWPTAVGQPSTGDSLQWTEAEQAQNITNFVNWAKGTGYIQDVTIFNYRDYGTNDWYGIESASGAHKLSYGALAAFRS